MKSPQANWPARRIVGLVLILVGTLLQVAVLASGAPPRHVLSADAQFLAGAPHIENAAFETRALAGSLEAAVRDITAQAAKPQWFGYSVDEIAGQHSVCCDNHYDGDTCATCRLEKSSANNTSHNIDAAAPANSTVKLEGSHQLFVLYRLEANRVTQIRVASEDCTLDAGGLHFLWLTGPKPAESVALLETFVRSADFSDRGPDHSAAHGALTAIALHADSSADRAMNSFIAPDQKESLRRQAAFWLGAARGKSGFAALQRMAKNDPSSDVRAQVAFALSVSHEPAATDEMIRMAHDDESSHVRGQALFWLAQKAGKKAVGTITGAIDNDPDTDVKKKAVFALSQLPKDEGVPKLIEVAQSNRNPAVRKQAIFWLGQSNDPRALAFFEKVLTQ
jgi:HEAT repeat protein